MPFVSTERFPDGLLRFYITALLWLPSLKMFRPRGCDASSTTNILGEAFEEQAKLWTNNTVNSNSPHCHQRAPQTRKTIRNGAKRPASL